MSHPQHDRPHITLIGALAENRVIGRENKLLWRLPEDMKFFRETTTGHPVIMGRNTFESIGRPLPKRRNIVLTRRTGEAPIGCEAAHSIEEAVELCKGSERIFVIGGAIIYKAFLPFADSMILTLLHHTWDGDAAFPEWNEAEWEMVWEKAGTTNTANPYLYTFREYKRGVVQG